MKTISILTALLLAGGGSPSPSRFLRGVTNPWFPLRPGTTLVYRGVKDGKPSRDVVHVTGATRRIAGVVCTAVSDRLYLRGRLAERTTDWYAQDKAGNVWYFGEDTAELDAHGKVTSREGSWLAGVHGARAGVFMPAQPRVGFSARQEYYKGHAEDHVRILSLSARVRTPAASSSRALLTKEWTPLEPGVIDHKSLRARDRHRAGADREGRRRAQRAGLGPPALTLCSFVAAVMLAVCTRGSGFSPSRQPSSSPRFRPRPSDRKAA